MDVQIVVFPETRVAAIEHVGSPAHEYATVRKLIAWKLEQGFWDPVKHRSYGVHHTDPRTVLPSEHRVDFCLSIESAVGCNSYGITDTVIPRNRCAFARDVGSRHHNQAAIHLFEKWLPRSGEQPGDFPIFFHYVNVGPHVREEDMLTDVYLPLRQSS